MRKGQGTVRQDDMMDAYDIRRLLPHRYPFLMVDRVFDIKPGEACFGEKLITLNEPCYSDLSDGIDEADLRYPVSLQLESFAQTGALLVLASRERIDVDEAFVMLAGSVRGMRIHRDVIPGEVLRHRVTIIKELSDTLVIGGEISAHGGGNARPEPVAEIASVVIAVRPKSALMAAQEAMA